MKAKWGTIIGIVLACFANQALGVTAAQKCQAGKLKIASKFSFCRLKAEAKAVKTGDPVDYSKCDDNLTLKWDIAETNGGGQCPTNGDQTGVQDQITADSDFIALKLSGVRFVDNGDGTVTDVQTRLMWEKKDDSGGIHDKDNVYAWSATGTAPDGTAFATFLGTLNDNQSTDGNTLGGCFAGHCDWRLPTIAELQTILLEPYPCATDPCIDPIFGPTKSFGHWSATTNADFPTHAWIVLFADGYVAFDVKIYDDFGYVRAVRGGS